ncbi:MAG: secretin N-terminal domain-containing protein, partial [Chthoniobacteraceae bacterium]|nr:secretin N-terminal domain-containing protein [Chthoniobacteraceae bacterium]
RVHVVTRPVNLPFLRTVIAKMDSSLPQGVPATRPLRFVLAGDVLDVVAGSVAEPGVEVKKLENKTTSNGAAIPVANNMANMAGYNSQNYGSRGANNPTLGGLAPGNTTLQADTAPEGRIIRNTKILADNRINAIIVVGNDEMKRKVFSLLDQIDVRAPQVMLTAVIGELTLNDNEQFGIDYLLSKGNLRSAITSGTLPWAIPASTVAGGSLKNIVSAASLPSTGGGVSGLIGVSNSLDLFVSALESTGRYRVTSRPMIFTSNNRAAVISSGEKIPIPANTTSGYTAGNTLTSTSTTDYIDVALKLSVLPLINSDGEVTLRITQEDNNTNGTTTISGNAIPNVTTRSIDTTVSVANEATIVLGGLVSEKKQTSNSGVPGLRKIPLVGSLFSYKTNTTTRTELVVLIRPTVTRGPVQSVKAGERAMQKTNFQPDLDASLDPPGTRVKQEKIFAAPQPSFRAEN